jgi:NIMA (never in mitosis gene a)-related kinase
LKIKSISFALSWNLQVAPYRYVDGGDLHKLVTETKKYNGSISEITIGHIASDILSALDHLHMKGILHRDLKTANIFIHADSYKLGDLNVSKVNAGKLAFTQTGTPYYASP